MKITWKIKSDYVKENGLKLDDDDLIVLEKTDGETTWEHHTYRLTVKRMEFEKVHDGIALSQKEWEDYRELCVAEERMERGFDFD